VWDDRGTRFEKLSGDELRSWCVLSEHGMILDEWSVMAPEDEANIACYAFAVLRRSAT